MIEISKKQQNIIAILLKIGIAQSSIIHSEVVKSGLNISLVTVKRDLSAMTKKKLLFMEGAGRSVRYGVTIRGRVFFDINEKEYCAIDPDKRYGVSEYNFGLFREFPADIFTNTELRVLQSDTKKYQRRIKELSNVIQKKELERLVIELSWKSSKIEGNTYTLLDTEKLILENKKAPGHSEAEAQMILNHKNAFHFVREYISEFKTLNRANLEKLHSILVDKLNVNLGFRNNLVGVTGSKYKPIDNIYQIQEAINSLSRAVSKMKTPYAKALLALLGISYIQPFEDGNKRTSRLMANALLLSHMCSPLSYRSVDENNYRNAMLVFYELNSIIPFKKIFIEQYEFASKNYSVNT